MPRAYRLSSERCSTAGRRHQNLRAAGIIYASDQIADLVAHGVDGVHLYSMNHPATTRRIWRNVEPLFTVE